MLPALESERQLLAIEAATFANPHVDPKIRRSILSRHMGRIRALSDESSRPKTKEDVLAALAASGFPIRVVPPKARRRATGRDGTRQGAKRGR